METCDNKETRAFQSAISDLLSGPGFQRAKALIREAKAPVHAAARFTNDLTDLASSLTFIDLDCPQLVLREFSMPYFSVSFLFFIKQFIWLIPMSQENQEKVTVL